MQKGASTLTVAEYEKCVNICFKHMRPVPLDHPGTGPDRSDGSGLVLGTSGPAPGSENWKPVRPVRFPVLDWEPDGSRTDHP